MLKKTLLALALISLGACQSMTAIPVTTNALLGSWHITQLRGQSVADFSPAQLTFAVDGKLSGNNSCNNFVGSYVLNGKQLLIKPVASTMKACVDVLMQQEQQIMQLLPQVTTAITENGMLQLVDPSGMVLITLSRH